MEQTYIAYYRVSTQAQGRSGLGLEAQQAAVRQHIKQAALLAEYQDIESGKSNTRQGIQSAIAHCEKTGATLVIAKLDRLSRNVQFIATLMNGGVKFMCCDMPDATPLTIHIFAAIAQQERERISDRIREALAAKRARGEALGTPSNFTAETRLLGSKAMKRNAETNDQNKQAKMVATLLRKQGCTLNHIANELNALGMQTSKGCAYRLEQVRRLLAQ